MPPDETAEAKYYKLKDEKLAVRGPFRVKPLEATKSMDKRENLIYPIPAPDGTELWPKKQWWWSKERSYAAIANNDLYFTKGKTGKWSVSYKQYLRDKGGIERRNKPFSIIDGTYNQLGSALIREIFHDRPHGVFQFPKPLQLIEKLISMLPVSEDTIVLDSFAGSGSTAHAVLKLNKLEGGNRRFICIEMEDYSNTITAERVKRVINGYTDVEGTGGSFDFYHLGQQMFLEDVNLNELVGIERIRQYVYYTETKTPLTVIEHFDSQYFLNKHNDTAYYFYYEQDGITTLDRLF